MKMNIAKMYTMGIAVLIVSVIFIVVSLWFGCVSCFKSRYLCFWWDRCTRGGGETYEDYRDRMASEALEREILLYRQNYL